MVHIKTGRGGNDKWRLVAMVLIKQMRAGCYQFTAVLGTNRHVRVISNTSARARMLSGNGANGAASVTICTAA